MKSASLSASPAVGISEPPSPWVRPFVLACAPALCLWVVLCWHLSSEWTINAQYSYGWFVPFFAIFLFWLRWEDRPEASPPSAASGDRLLIMGAVATILILFPVRLFEIANPDWRPLGWLHAFAVGGLTLLGLWRAGGWPWLRHFAFPVAFFFVALPWVTPIERPVVQGLMRVIAASATEALTLCGVPAELEGSVIRINSGVVGVNEACSGVRSLQTSLMIGLLFGELKRLTVGARVILLSGAIGIALLANFSRAFFLVWIAATKGIGQVSRWHDIAGYAIVGAVFVGSMALSGWLSPRAARAPDASGPERPRRLGGTALPLGTSFALAIVCGAIVVEAGVELWYRSHERDLVPRRAWTIQWPEKSPGFREIHIDEAVKTDLRFDDGREATWPVPWAEAGINQSAAAFSLGRDQTANAYMFYFRWKPGSGSILHARSHRPDICLPSTGWKQTDDHQVRSYDVAPQFALPFHHLTFTREFTGNAPALFAETFYCLREDYVRASELDAVDLNAGATSNWTVPERWDAVRTGLRNPGQQLLEIVVLSRSQLDAAEAQARFAALIPQLVKPQIDRR